MKKNEFVAAYYKYAIETEIKTGISAIATLAQAALESGWGKHAPGNMFFGIKDTDGINNNEQLLTTTEYSKRSDLTFPVIISITPVTRKGQKYFKYVVKDYFRAYKTPEESFTDHAQLFMRVKRYRQALKYKAVPERFLEEVAKAGYATAPDYAEILIKIVKEIKVIVEHLKL